jgi:hypothetical protein
MDYFRNYFNFAFSVFFPNLNLAIKDSIQIDSEVQQVEPFTFNEQNERQKHPTTWVLHLRIEAKIEVKSEVTTVHSWIFIEYCLLNFEMCATIEKFNIFI